jgi:hypothetical protein
VRSRWPQGGTGEGDQKAILAAASAQSVVMLLRYRTRKEGSCLIARGLKRPSRRAGTHLAGPIDGAALIAGQQMSAEHLLSDSAVN